MWNTASHIVFKWLGLVLLVSLFSCKKAEDRLCWKKKGEDVVRRLALPDFELLRLNKKLNYVLVEDTSNFLLIRAGKNMVKHIAYSFDNEGFLHIENHNKCNFLRDQTIIPKVEIHYKTFKELRYEGSEQLSNQDTLHFAYFKFTILDANGSLNLTVDIDSLHGEVAFGMGDYTLKGRARVAELGLRSNGFGNVEQLKITERLYAKNESPGNLFVNADQTDVTVSIAGTGNVYYSGTPATLQTFYFSSGRFLPK